MSVYISGQSGTLVLLVRWCSIEWCDSPSRCECTQECTGGQRPSTQRPCHRVLLLSAADVALTAAAAAVLCCYMLLYAVICCYMLCAVDVTAAAVTAVICCLMLL